MDIRAIIWATFTANSYSLAAQWLYDQEQIAKTVGRIDYLAPAVKDGYHAPKGAGEFCNYGDHIFHLLRYIDEKKSFEQQDYFEHWKIFFSNYTGYKDQASKKLLAKGLNTEQMIIADYAATLRFPPLLLITTDPDTLFDLAWQEASMTYNNPFVRDALRCMIQAVFLTGTGMPPLDALVQAAEPFDNITALVEAGLRHKHSDTNKVVQTIGASCGIDVGIPVLVHLLFAYSDLKELLIANNLAGGDVASRGMAAAILFSAHKGMDVVPEAWRKSLQQYETIARILA